MCEFSCVVYNTTQLNFLFLAVYFKIPIMKHFLLFVFLSVGLFGYAQDSLLIQGTKYKVDTLVHQHRVGLNSFHTYFSLPDWPLTVNTLTIDLNNPHLRFYACHANDSTRGLERPSSVMLRKNAEGKNAFAAINGDFYTTTGVDAGWTVNGQVTEGQLLRTPASDRPLILFDAQYAPYADFVSFNGSVNIKGQSTAINGVNVSRGTNQLILYNQFHGIHSKTNDYGTEVVVGLKEGRWAINKPLIGVVKSVIKGKGSNPIAKGEIILSGHGTAQQILDNLISGDEISLSIELALKGQPTLNAQFEEMIGGDRLILKDGIVQDNDWKELHPRTAIGYSKDKTKLVMVVVDGRSTTSSGFSTKQLAELIRLSGAEYALNLDGGGSSAMVVRDKVCNTPADGSERRVANSLVVGSTSKLVAPASLELNATALTLPFGKKYQVKASTVNDDGDVLDYLSASGVQYRLVNNIGVIDQNGLFTANGDAPYGLIIAELNGMKDTIKVVVKPAVGLQFSQSKLVIDNRNQYTFKIYGLSEEGAKFAISNGLLKFSSDDEGVATVDEQGVLNPKQTGIANIKVCSKDGKLEDWCAVHVEVGVDKRLMDDFSDVNSWTVSSYMLDEVTLSRVYSEEFKGDVLKVDYVLTYNKRTSSITLAKDILVYGMPDSITLEVAASNLKNSFLFSLDHPSGSCYVPAFTSNVAASYNSPINVAMISQESYPLKFKSIRLTLERDAALVAGTVYRGSFLLHALKSSYPTKGQATSVGDLEDDQPFSVYPNPARSFVMVKPSQLSSERLMFNLLDLSGRIVLSKTFESSADGFRVDLEGLPQGIYLYQIHAHEKMMHGKIILGIQ